MSRTIRRKSITFKNTTNSVEAIRYCYITYDYKRLHRDNYSGIFTPKKYFRRKLNKKYNRKIKLELTQIRLNVCEYYDKHKVEDACWMWF